MVAIAHCDRWRIIRRKRIAVLSPRIETFKSTIRKRFSAENRGFSQIVAEELPKRHSIMCGKTLDGDLFNL